ncbi:MAG: hypothetical protein EXS49_02155, partial [Candidatus Pacebacteria bacterium]|nr:hypothetical protein [Candidatus Paceibacterota bacterium]
MGTKSDGLWKMEFGQLGATLKVLQDRGVTLAHMERLRSDSAYADRVAASFVDMRSALVSAGMILGDASVQMESWIKFYRDRYSIKLNDVASIAIPEHQQGFDRLIVVAEGLT